MKEKTFVLKALRQKSIIINILLDNIYLVDGVNPQVLSNGKHSISIKRLINGQYKVKVL